MFGVIPPLAGASRCRAVILKQNASHDASWKAPTVRHLLCLTIITQILCEGALPDAWQMQNTSAEILRHPQLCYLNTCLGFLVVSLTKIVAGSQFSDHQFTFTTESTAFLPPEHEPVITYYLYLPYLTISRISLLTPPPLSRSSKASRVEGTVLENLYRVLSILSQLPAIISFSEFGL